MVRKEERMLFPAYRVGNTSHCSSQLPRGTWCSPDRSICLC